jgi:4-aminobutyrate--pyruvate transaminase
MDENLIENSKKIGSYFLEQLQSLEGHPTVGEARGTGLWLGLDFTSDKKNRTPYPMENLLSMVLNAKKQGLLIKPMGCALEFAPPLIIQKEEIDEAILILDKVIEEEEKRMGM